MIELPSRYLVLAARRVSLMIALLSIPTSSARAVVDAPPGYADELIVGGLAAPTSFAFLPDGRVLVTEQRTGAIRFVVNGTLVAGALVTVPELSSSEYEQGLLSIAVDPRWPTHPYVYVHHTRTNGTLRLVRFTATGSLSDPGSTSLALGSLYSVLEALPDADANHNGGALRFGPDGHLYLSLGEDLSGCLAQDSTSMRGCVLRLDVSGLPAGAGGPPLRADLVPADNPFVSSPSVNARLVYAYGLRNPFRFHIDPVTGLVYLADVGESLWEEMNELRSGDNAGWPHREGPALFSYPSCPEPGGAGSGAFVGPIDSYGHGGGVVVISADVLRRGPGSTWPAAWEGNVFYADYTTGFLRMLEPGGPTGWQRAVVPGQPTASHWAIGLDYPVDFLRGPDGELWWLAQFNSSGGGNTGMLRRIVGDPGGQVAVPPASARLPLGLSVAPNPSREAVTFTLELPRSGEARLVILDVAGRQVAIAASGTREAGRLIATWDGRRADGTPAPAGLYLARLEMDGTSVTTRLARVD